MADDQYSPDRSSLYRFKLDRILGEGGTGRVYRGMDTKSGEVHAVKLFKENFFQNRLHVRDLARGVKKFRKFEHPNIVHVYEFIDGKEGRCLVMEYVGGPNLKWYMLNRPFKLNERIQIMMQLCGGLQYLHDKGCVHYDFKPSNVLFTQKGTAKIADYSLYWSNPLLELFGQSSGEQITPMFVAPEFIRKEKVSDKCDQYSLGVTAYMMFTNRVPFPVDNLQQLYNAHLRAQPDPPSQVNPEIPAALNDIILKLMAKKPENRYENCDKARIELANITTSRI